MPSDTPQTTNDIGTIEPEYPLAPLREVLAGSLSDSASFRLLVEGRYGTREIDLLVRQLIVTKDALS